MSKLFLPQTTLEEWALSDKADLDGERLAIKEDAASYPVTPAVLFARLVSGEDGASLLSRVKTAEELERLGAEQMMDSVLLGETAYEVVPGYVTEVSVVAPTAPAVEGGSASSSGGNPESDLLAAFLLDKL